MFEVLYNFVIAYLPFIILGIIFILFFIFSLIFLIKSRKKFKANPSVDTEGIYSVSIVLLVIASIFFAITLWAIYFTVGVLTGAISLM